MSANKRVKEILAVKPKQKLDAFMDCFLATVVCFIGIDLVILLTALVVKEVIK